MVNFRSHTFFLISESTVGVLLLSFIEPIILAFVYFSQHLHETQLGPMRRQASSETDCVRLANQLNLMRHTIDVIVDKKGSNQHSPQSIAQ